ncbi:MAG: hypothetical protein RL255_633, partial [Actinomycetota bacterium]
IEVGIPYSDPVMDGPVIQQTSEAAIKNGIKTSDVFEIVTESSVPTYVMSYWNPIEKYGIKKFASDLAQSGGVGVITPDLTVEESQEWNAATDEFNIDRTYVVAPSSTDSRLSKVAKNCTGFVYAASLMGVTGARSVLSNDAKDLVSRIRAVSEQPISVGLGVSNREQASEISEFADGVIVGSAFLKLLLEGRGPDAVGELAKDLSAGVRKRSS